MWRKLGLLFTPGRFDWMTTHAQNPLPERLQGSRYRVHFATRDRQNRSRGGFFDFDLGDVQTVLAVSERPTLDLGELGAFDDSGVMPSSLAEADGQRRLYYTGWSRTVDVPFAFHIGLASSSDQKSRFERVSRAPVLGRNHHDPFITGAPCVLREGSRHRMWYISATRWEAAAPGTKPKHYYTVKHADSTDGVVWHTSPHVCIPYAPDEYAIARPVVFMEGSAYRMWFTFRGGSDTYRVGTAASTDGINWRRDPAPLGIDVSADGWDSTMICYAYPFTHDGRRYALYNGNNYGETGIGLAIYEG
jgi:hypothetical protein